MFELQKRTSEFIKGNMPNITCIEYFSDGCAGQYKNFKNFLNLCHHKNDFGLDANWSFFATSHGKSPCDGIGGTVKRQITRASLQRPSCDQIVSFEAVKEFCQRISGITFFCISKDDMIPVRKELSKRYELGSTVEGTRSCHFFQPVSTSCISAKYLSSENFFSISHSFQVTSEEATARVIESLKPSEYITCVYGNHWWLALVCEVNRDQRDVYCKFMHPHGYTENFYWPSRDDEVYVPFSKILLKVNTPNVSSRSGRHYTISKNDIQQTVEAFNKI